jgi:hypothetical protein
MHWSIYSTVIGFIMFMYISLFVKNMQSYKDSEYNMSWGQFIDKTIG